MDGVRDRLVAKCRQLAPVRVKVYDAEDNVREVAVPTRRRRWASVVETIEARPWVRVVFCDKSGAELGHLENDGPAEEIEEIGVRSGTPTGGAQYKWFVELMLKGQGQALQWRDKEMQTLLGAVAQVVDLQSRMMLDMLERSRIQREEEVELAQLRAAAEKGDDMDQIVKLVEASPRLMPIFAPIMRMFLPAGRSPAPAPTPPAAPPAAPKNGAKS